MIPEIRRYINKTYTTEHYARLRGELRTQLGEEPDFRVAESPVVVPTDLTQKLRQACTDICSQLLTPEYLKLSQGALPPHQEVPGCSEFPELLVLDFGITHTESGQLHPMLIELQGFPSLFAYQAILAKAYHKIWGHEVRGTPYLSGYTHETYLSHLNNVICGNHPPGNVVLLEIDPAHQKTRADFMATERLLGVQTLCLSEIRRSGRELYYEKDGKKLPIYRVYNRIIFDELEQRPEFIRDWNLLDPIEAEWVSHPNWYFRLSKFSLPYLHSTYVPESLLLSQISQIPDELSDWVLKPLYSFAGSGVQVDVTPEMLKQIEHPEHYLLQRKVQYEPVVNSPSGGVKVEIRMMIFIDSKSRKPEIITNLARFSRGKLIGVRYNEGLDWVGGSSAFFME
jgi:hypothetical protein